MRRIDRTGTKHPKKKKKKKKKTPPQLAREWGIGAKKVHAWIRSGELRAVDVSTRLGGRPRYLIDQAAITEFEARRSTVVKPKQSAASRRKLRPQDPTVIEFF